MQEQRLRKEAASTVSRKLMMTAERDRMIFAKKYKITQDSRLSALAPTNIRLQSGALVIDREPSASFDMGASLFSSSTDVRLTITNHTTPPVPLFRMLAAQEIGEIGMAIWQWDQQSLR